MLLSDLVMANVGGRELAEQLRTALASLKVIFVSGYPGHRTADNDLELRDAYFLPKPFSMQRLARTVREVLDGSARQAVGN